MINIPKLPPFKRFCITIGAIPATYIESLSYYETLLWLCKYLQDTVIPAVNTNAAAVTELQEAFVTLQSYVDNYFENLDVQTEINNKLDEMVESGEFQEIIAQYLNTQIIYNTTELMLEDIDNIDVGTKVQTLGYYNINDGGGALFIITDTEPSDSYIQEGTKYARFIKEENSIYNVLQYGAKCDNDTDCSTIVNNLISYITSNGGGTLYFPKNKYNQYRMSNIQLKYGVNIISDNASFKPSNDNANPMFKLNSGAITNINYSLKIKGLNILANDSNTNQTIFDFTAINNESNGGGLWHSQIEDITIFGLKQNQVGINLNGVDADSVDNVNQYLAFNNINIYRNSESSICLKVYGQLGQTQFRNCEFNGSSKNLNGYNVKMESKGTSNDNILGGIRFENTTFQASQYGVYADYCTGLNFVDCWFENLQNALYFINNSHIKIDNCHFTNLSSETLKPIMFGNGCSLCGDNNYIQGQYGDLIRPISNSVVSNGINAHFNMWNYYYLQAYETTKVITPTSSELVANNNKIICYQLTGNNLLTTIKSMLPDGESLTIYVDPTVNASYLIRINASSTDIILPDGVDNYAIHAGQSITLKPISIVGMNTRKWVVVNTTGVITPTN